jgi:hypothetical protein
MADAELTTFRNSPDEHLPERTAHMSDADLAGLRPLMKIEPEGEADGKQPPDIAADRVPGAAAARRFA